MDQARPFDKIIHSLQERAKELKCVYRIDELLAQRGAHLEDIFRSIVEVIPGGWQYPGACRARIIYRNKSFHQAGLVETEWVLSADIREQGETCGRLDVFYVQEMPSSDEGPFLNEERKLLDTIADRISLFVQHRALRTALDTRRPEPGATEREKRESWWVILDFLRMTDISLLKRISRRMINQLVYTGVTEARDLLAAASQLNEPEGPSDENKPMARHRHADLDSLTDAAFRIASEHLSENAILSSIHQWIKEDNIGYLLTTLENLDAPLIEVADALERFGNSGVEPSELGLATQIALRVALIRRLFTERIDYIGAARNYLEIEDFAELFMHIVVPSKSRGKLGGKSAGLFLASKIIEKSTEYAELLGVIKVPKTWYIPSDALLDFIHYNELEDVYNWKYLEADKIRQEYPHLIEAFKDSNFPSEMVKGLSMALDDFGDSPLIVRSSSLLEDRLGSAFSGKYKSLFLANRGTKPERLAALMDAIAEVYASVFGPDPIEYRSERGLLYHHEEMGIMIQEVVGKTIGPYFLPAFSGVAFSNNELRWSPRIKREDGLLRMVPGMGTRAVDRLGDDYPVLVALGQPRLKANVTIDEVLRYSPAWIDLINLEKRTFESVRLRDLLRDFGDRYPRLELLVSVIEGDRLRQPIGRSFDFASDHLVFTFEGLVGGTAFVTRMQSLMKLLREVIGTPVDIEFASDGESLYLLQCRPQSYGDESAPAPIPHDVPEDRIAFTGKKYISNGKIPEITHIVYVVPERYNELEDPRTMKEVGRAVGRLNRLLPKRQFILMGPGRWGSRGDIKLGVSVTYADINNAAALIEIARKKGNYVPDLSFGTHFFQDLVEASIRYLPLYPDDPGVRFNNLFLERSDSILARLLPEFAHLDEVVRVIDVPTVTGGQILRVLMNADLQEAVGMLVPPGAAETGPAPRSGVPGRQGEEYWRWRLRMAQKIASEIDPARFGVKGFYVFGSTKNASAGPASDIDVIVHFAGTPEMKVGLEQWLEGWSLCLGEMNFLRTGYRTPGGLLDVHLVTDEDIEERRSYAAKIGAVTDAARPLQLRDTALEPPA